MIATVVVTVVFYSLKMQTRAFKSATEYYTPIVRSDKPLRGCQVDINNLLDSGLHKIQNERKSRIREVCEMCRRNGSSMECRHLTMDEDYHNASIYNKLFVDDKHKVSIKIRTKYCCVPNSNHRMTNSDVGCQEVGRCRIRCGISQNSVSNRV